MLLETHKQGSGSQLYKPLNMMLLLGGAIILAAAIVLGGLKLGYILLLLPLMALVLSAILRNPELGIYSALVLGFLNSGLTRYITGIPFGLGIDILLVLALIGLIFLKFRNTEWLPLRNNVFILATMWLLYVVIEILNPESQSVTAWFYAMRGIGFYQLIAFSIVFMLLRENKHLNRYILIIFWLSLLGTFWGLRQFYFGTDAAEDYWLFVENHQAEHILFGKLRVFSFYSDAGQFGASQAMISLVAGIMAISPGKTKFRIFSFIVFLFTFIGFSISGTRGALMVPAAGGLIYLIINKNFKILLSGLVGALIIFYILKYTFLFHGVEQVQRMRTALDPDNPSLQARLNNQKTFRKYLTERPFGGGIGTAGYWGNRFSPNTLLAQTPTDSWYVKIWAETGIVGLAFYMFTLGYIMGQGAVIITRIEDQGLKSKIMALYAGIGGVLLSSYGNQVFGQMPTGMIMNMAIPMIILAPVYDKQLLKMRNTSR